MADGHKKRKRNRRPAWLAEYLVFVLVAFVLRSLRFRMAMRLGGALGELVYRLDARHRKVTDENLAKCLTDMTPTERSDIARSIYRNLGYNAIEFIRSDRYAREPLERHFSFTNYEIYEKARAKGRGVAILTAHCGNWELLAMSHALQGYPSGVVVRPLDNPYLDRAVTAIRSMYGNIMINKKGGMRQVLKTLAGGGTVGLLLDQNVTRSEGVFVEFFGMPACTNKGLALIASKTKVPVIPTFIRRTGFDMHEIVVGDELPLIDTGDKDADIKANTQAYTKAIEDFIRKYPDQWFWMHRRWKTKPKEHADA